MDRRHFLTLSLVALLDPIVFPLARALGGVKTRETTYAVDVGILHGLISLHLDGRIREEIDRAAGRYDLIATGEGDGITNRIESSGVLRDGRWRPLRALGRFSVKGRESTSEIIYDYARRTVRYHFRGETFFLRRVRIADDIVRIPATTPVDDSVSAALNYADGLWGPGADGTLETFVVRRKRGESEQIDDVQQSYRAELVPFRLKVTTDPTNGKPVADFDLTGFSSWAKRDHPAHVVFDRDRRPESMTLSMVLGTSVSIGIKSA